MSRGGGLAAGELAEFDAGVAETTGAVADAGAAAVAAVPPSIRIGIGSLRTVTYCCFTGSKEEKASAGIAGFLSLGEMTLSNVFWPLMPTSSSCLNFEDGGYLCQPFSSSRIGAFIRSKFPRPEMVVVSVIGSPTWRVLGFASTAIVKLPTAPAKLGGALGGSGLTSRVTGSLNTGTRCC